MSEGATSRDTHLKQLRAAVHEDVEVREPVDGGVILVGPGGTRLVDGSTKDVDTWIDRRSRWGNPFKIEKDGGEYSRAESVELYKGWFYGHLETSDGRWDQEDIEELRGMVLGCWCLPQLCHGIVVMNHLAETHEPAQEALIPDGGPVVPHVTPRYEDT